ncbi:MAG: hydantoinase/oxoprolinase family protein, partial [Dehalococcoidales bacterium]
NIRQELRQFLKTKGIEEDKLGDFTLVAYGGGGPTRYAGFVNGMNFRQILTSPYASTFCAFGFSTTDLLHRYSKYLPLTIFNGANYLDGCEKLNQTVMQLMEIARRDIGGEGFSAQDAGYYLELVGDNSLAEFNVRAEKLQFTSEEDVKQLCAQFSRPGQPAPAEVSISTIILNAFVPMPHFELTPHPLAGEDARAALRKERDIFWSPEAGYRKTPIYDRELLVPGNRVTGPAVVEAKDTTYVIPEDKAFYIGEYSHGVLEEV